MELISYKKNATLEQVRVFSIGGGSIIFENDVYEIPEKVYSLDKFSLILKYCEEKNIRLWQYALENENKNFLNYMYTIWDAMKTSIKNGLVDTVELPAVWGSKRKQNLCLIINTSMNPPLQKKIG